MDRPRSQAEPQIQDQHSIAAYLQRRKDVRNVQDYVMAVPRHRLLKIPSWMSPFDALGVDLDGRLVFDPWHYDKIRAENRTDKMYVVAVDPIDNFMDIRLYWNPDTQVWIGLIRGTARVENAWPVNRGLRIINTRKKLEKAISQEVREMEMEKESIHHQAHLVRLTTAAKSRVSHTLAMRRAARDAAQALG